MAFLERNANSGSVATGYDIDNPLKFEADNSEYMHYACSGQTDYERMAYSVWLKRTELGTGQVFMEFGHGTANTSNLRIGFDSSDRLFCYGNSIVWRQTNRVFRDISAWYHLFFLFDTTTPGGVSNNRIRIWVNGEMIDHGDFGVINNPGAGSAMGFNNSLNHSIGRQTEDATAYFCGYMAQVYESGGTPPVVGDFAETDDNGIWIPIDISEITPPDANGFNLDFSSSGSLGNDISSRNNDFTLVNIAAADQSTDTPTNNFCTLNPLIPYAVQSGSPVISQGATYHNGSGGWTGMKGTIGFNKGKWYWELQTNSGSGGDLIYGVQTVAIINNQSESTATSAHNLKETAAWYVSGGHWIADQTSNRDDVAASSVSHTIGNTVVYGIGLNMDDGEVTYYANGSAITNLTNIDLDGLAGETVAPFCSVYNQAVRWNLGGYTTISISSAASDANGYGTFEYAPPSGYYALCTKNLAEYG